MNALLINPRFPDTFWSFSHAIKFVAAQATHPSLSLLTIAAMLPTPWPKKLVDVNIEPLTKAHLTWADIVFVTAMQIQAPSADQIINLCHQAGVKTCAGGVYFTANYSIEPERFRQIDHLFIGEAEETIPVFLADLAQGQAKSVYQAEHFPDLKLSPTPAWQLINFFHYDIMPIQFSRGCPFDCDFCHVIILFGRQPRLKTPTQVLTELTALFQAGWRRTVMFVDDNIIAHKGKARELLQALITWQTERNYPFLFLSQASIDLADQPELLALMFQAGFFRLFIGIETPAAKSLIECNKTQNSNRDLVGAIRTIQKYGIEVMGGFILGFDSDPPSIFIDQLKFIEDAAIPLAMIGLLAAPPGTRLFQRLEAEGRITGQSNGDSTMNLKGMNLIPLMGLPKLISGYRNLLSQLYEPNNYYNRVLHFFDHLRLNPYLPKRLPNKRDLRAFLRIVWELGVLQSDRYFFWLFIGRVLAKYRQFFPKAIALAAEGYHVRLMSRHFAHQTKQLI
jgi:radical SAM superfamily enzyme YgiQ (UPF0313 family)